MAVPVPMAELRPVSARSYTTELGVTVQDDCDQHHGVVPVPPRAAVTEAVSEVRVQMPSRRGFQACRGKQAVRPGRVFDGAGDSCKHGIDVGDRVICIRVM